MTPSMRTIRFRLRVGYLDSIFMVSLKHSWLEQKDEMKEEIFKDFAMNAKIHFENMEVIAESHIEIIIIKDKDGKSHLN